MKRALRMIVPLILALAVLACTAWYFLVYDQAFTKELLLENARRFEDSGNHKISAFLYDVAYFQSSRDDDVAIELAQQYLDDGNYTKAEYTLSEAITNNPTAQLYITLSSIYVQQDKLLDAVNLINTVADPTIRAVLESRRPQAPTMTPTPAFYSQYITVEVSAASGTLYVNADAQYPSVQKDLYQGPITLGSGETVLYALAVSDEGLASPLTICGYTIGGVIEPVQFHDEAVEKAIRTTLGVGESDVVFTNQLWDIVEFTVPADAESYEDLSLLTYLNILTLEKGSQGDLSAIKDLKYLKELTVQETKLTEADMQIIAGHTGLTKLALPGCSLSSIAPLESLTQLTYLDLSGNSLRNIGVLSVMTSMKELYLGNNVISDLSVLSGLTLLERLDISYNAVSSLEPLRGMHGTLVYLAAGHNQLNSTQGLADLKKLQQLDLSFNNIADIASLSVLTELTHLDVSNNALTSVSGTEALLMLRIFNFSYNQVTELPPFNPQCQLVSLDASHNLLLNVDPLAGLPMLNSVNVDYNAEIESLEPLDQCYLLIRVNAYGTKVTEVSFLTAKSIVVNYDPTLVEEDK